MILKGVDHYRVTEANFEGVRVILSYRGEKYTPAYVQGISGQAFRVAGICPCAPTCSGAMDAEKLIELLGYRKEYLKLEVEGVDPKVRVQEVLARVTEEIRANRPVLLWHAFTNAEWDVVCGFDEEKKELVGRGSYAGLEGYARAPETRTLASKDLSGLFGALLVGEKASTLNARKAEAAALKEAVRHARDRRSAEKLGKEKWTFLEGLMAYDRWASDWKTDPAKTPGAGDSYCLGVYRSTHRAAGEFLREIAPHYPGAVAHLQRAAAAFAAEADTLDQCVPLIGWNAPKGKDPTRNAQAAALLGRARDCYARATEEIEAALPLVG